MDTLDVQGMRMPKLGFGTWKLKGEEAREAVTHALYIGYRHIDTAQVYDNEAQVGAAIADASVDREDLFITTKVWMDRYARGDLEASARESLERLGVDYVDLLILHWPNPDFPIEQTIEALNQVKENGHARHIGVSNFTTMWLGEAVAATRHPLAVNQVEYHPFIDQTPVLDAVEKYDMCLTAYCPIAQGEVFKDETLGSIAKRHGKTPAQVALRWLIQQPRVSAIPRSSNAEHAKANFDIFDFELSDHEMGEIAKLRRSDRRIVDPSWAPAWDVAA